MNKGKKLKDLSFILALSLVTASLYVPAAAEPVSEILENGAETEGTLDKESGFYFTKGYDTATITGYEGDSCENPVIPLAVSDENGEYRVSAIAANAFEDDTHLTGNLTIQAGKDIYGDPESIYVYTKAFCGCTGLTSLTIAEGTSIADDAFDGCSNVKLVVNYANDSVRLSALGSDGHKWTDEKGNEIDKIAGGTAKRDDYVSQKFTVDFVSDGEITVDSQEIEENSRVKKPNDPTRDGFLFDGWYIDKECTEEYNFDLPVNKNFKLYAKWKEAAGSGELFQDSESKLYFTVNADGKTASIARNEKADPIVDTGIDIDEDLIIPSQVKDSSSGKTYPVTVIGAHAFEGKRYTKNITIPNGITDIGERAFYGCLNTGELVIPDSVVSIGKEAFYQCSSLTEISVSGNSLKSIGEMAFKMCFGLKGSLVLSDSIESIGKEAFFACSGFDGGLYLGKSLKTIGENAFSADLTGGGIQFTGSLVIPDTVESIGADAFNGCSGFNGTLTLGKKISVIPERAFSGCEGFTGNLVIPDSVTKIEKNAFASCKGFSGNLTISNNVAAIGDSAFRGCTGFGGVLTIGTGLKELESIATDVNEINTFLGCTGIQKVVNNSSCEVPLQPMNATADNTWKDSSGNVVKTIVNGTAYRNDYPVDDAVSETVSNDSVSNNAALNAPSELKTEGRSDYKISYYHKIAFYGKAKPAPSFFGDGLFTVSDNSNKVYKVSKVKVNKKKLLIQITGLEGADKAVVKAVKKATKGTGGLAFELKPYYVNNESKVTPIIKKKDGSVKSVKVNISGKDYKLKKNEFTYDSASKVITFTGENVKGTYKIP